MPHPHGPECTCPPLPADAGLLAYTVDCEHHAQLVAHLQRLAESNVATLRVLTTDPQPPANLVELPTDPRPCTGQMTCACPTCTDERIARVRTGVREIRQPWDAKKRAA